MILFRSARIGAAVLALSVVMAHAAEPSCPVPQALGIARSVTVGDAVRVGLKTYPQTIDLKDHEVVLTFDDGPSSKTTPRILDALAAQCVKANFFLIGRSAAASPGIVRREIAEGHTVGHHTWSHPAVTLRGLGEAAALADIDRGMAADDKAAYGSAEAAPRVPFFRFPGFADTKPLLDDLSARRIAVFGTDLWASDWVPMTPDVELVLLMGRLHKAGRGIILLHDTKRQTADMLPKFLEALKSGGFHVVHVIPGSGPTPIRPAPAGWASETEEILSRMGTMAHRHDALPLSAPGAPTVLEPKPEAGAPSPQSSALPNDGSGLRDTTP